MTANIEEVLNLTISTVFFVYLVFFIGNKKQITASIWYYALIFLMFSRVFTVAESYCMAAMFDVLEHISLTLASLLFLISIVKKQL